MSSSSSTTLNRGHEKISFGKGCLCNIFFVFCAGICNVYNFYVRGSDDAFQWGTGYLSFDGTQTGVFASAHWIRDVLEWMLSVDNPFVFQRVCQSFKTPDDQKHKPLFWGIIGAIVFRMAFCCIEEMLMHKYSWMHIIFGLFLIYTGFKAAIMDDEEDRPDLGVVFVWFTERIPHVIYYTREPLFFLKVPVDQSTGEVCDIADKDVVPRGRRT